MKTIFVSKTNWIFESVLFTHVFKDSNMVDNFYNNKLIDLNFKTIYIDARYWKFFIEKRYLNYLPWSFDGHGPMKILRFQHGGHSVLRKLNIWSKCHFSIQVRKILHRKIENNKWYIFFYLYTSTGHCMCLFAVILKVGVKCKQLTDFSAHGLRIFYIIVIFMTYR